MKRELLFSLTKKDFRIDTFRSGGKGGQHQNTTNSGCRITHIESGAVGESRDGRSFHQNRKKALDRLVQSKTFQTWHRKKCAELMMDRQALDKNVNNSMREENIKAESFNGEKWEVMN